ncbi:MAG: tetratricopeptide repeat protein [Bryobacteraceae bacterium]
MPRQTLLSGTSFIGTFVLVFVALAALFAVDTFLVRIERAEDQAEATRLVAEGRAMMQGQRYAEAAERFKDAISIDRNNRDYWLALADALLAAKNFMEAESALDELLQRDSTDGDANLAMARVLVGESKIAEGISFYHRAIYGRWTTNAAQNRLKARFELVDLLARQNAKAELLAELLPLQDEASFDLQTRTRIGELFLAAGSPARAADVFRDIVHRDSRNADAYAGLGQAEFASGDYQQAEADFLDASRLKPDDADIRKRLELCEQILSLDPTRRGLASNERYERSLKLVSLALDQIKPCLLTPPPGPAQELVDAANKTLKARVAELRQNAATDSNLDLAEQLWKARGKDCGSSTPASDDPLSLVLAKIAR